MWPYYEFMMGLMAETMLGSGRIEFSARGTRANITFTPSDSRTDEKGTY